MKLKDGTTSACAENTHLFWGQVETRRNYLRVRGEYITHNLYPTNFVELPPRARRIPAVDGVPQSPVGTTSACAENTGKHRVGGVLCGNYLRVRGEYARSWPTRIFRQELPPRARRIPRPLPMCWAIGGTTSACAENTGLRVIMIPVWRNYLRVRGEYKKKNLSIPPKWELPPRARRIQSRAGPALTAGGTTSACAENTLTWGCFVVRIRNYLRVRGEYLGGELHNLPRQELPPRARRIRFHYLIGRVGGGTTSACAENTDSIITTPTNQWNYLRVRGEYTCTRLVVRVRSELPPRARRIPCPRNRTPGYPWNYLRVRGEYYLQMRGEWEQTELPPRARRIHSHFPPPFFQYGTTSACAENTLNELGLL